MKLFALLSLALGLLVAQTGAANLVCYYDSASYIREGEYTVGSLSDKYLFSR